MSPIIVWIIISPFLVKFPIFILHIWLPKAHVEAPTFGSIILAGILLKFGVFGFIRFSTLFKILQSSYIILMVCFLCCISILCTIFQNDTKMLIAYNSVSHMSLIFIFIIFFLQSSKDFCILISFTHGITASMLFHFAGDFYQIIKTRILFYSSCLLFIRILNISCFVVFIFSNLGLPPLLSSCITKNSNL